MRYEARVHTHTDTDADPDPLVTDPIDSELYVVWVEPSPYIPHK
jgi:hypothetical protein